MDVGILHLVQRDNNGRLLIQLFKFLLLLLSSTPYVNFFCVISCQLFMVNDFRFIVKYCVRIIVLFDICNRKNLSGSSLGFIFD